MKTAASRRQRGVSREQRRAIVERVRQALEPHQPRAYRLVAEPETLGKHGDEWVMVVRPDRESAPLGDSVTRAMAAEDEMRRRWHIDIMLLPVIPPEDD
jgi:hypothetical protein